MQECKCSSVQQVPMASFEAAQARHNHLLVTLIVCWTVSIVVLGFALICAMSYTEEAVEEIVTTETSTEVAQNADNSGSNYFAGGDMSNGYANSEANGQDDQDDQNDD